jgi:hypothetical protein
MAIEFVPAKTNIEEIEIKLEPAAEGLSLFRKVR